MKLNHPASYSLLIALSAASALLTTPALTARAHTPIATLLSQVQQTAFALWPSILSIESFQLLSLDFRESCPK
ncbi:MAG: hypothetical protein F6J95_027220 [Leptolyngbya sp. SIO1E4]|nr:hypothetical protein [Leptolyngbya sp. SIO1E4]